MAEGGGYSTEVSAALIPGFDAELSAPRFSPLPLASVFGAMEAAMAIPQGMVVFPNATAEQREKGLTDFNDLALQNPRLAKGCCEMVFPQGVPAAAR